MAILKRLICSVVLLVSTAHAQWFVGTNEFGHRLATQAKSDFEGRYAFVTNDVQPPPDDEDNPEEIVASQPVRGVDGKLYEIIATPDGTLNFKVPDPSLPEKVRKRIRRDAIKSNEVAVATIKQEAKEVRTNTVALIRDIKPFVDAEVWTNTSNKAQGEQIEKLFRILEKSMKEQRDAAGIDLQQLREKKDAGDGN